MNSTTIRVSPLSTPSIAKNVRVPCPCSTCSTPLQYIELYTAHSDEIWDIAWTATDAVLSASADGTIKQWDSTSGQVSLARPPHNLAIVSLSVSPNGHSVLYNGLDGTTCLWDLTSDTIVGRHESYDRSVEGAEPCKCSFTTMCSVSSTKLHKHGRSRLTLKAERTPALAVPGTLIYTLHPPTHSGFVRPSCRAVEASTAWHANMYVLHPKVDVPLRSCAHCAHRAQTVNG